MKSQIPQHKLLKLTREYKIFSDAFDCDVQSLNVENEDKCWRVWGGIRNIYSAPECNVTWGRAPGPRYRWRGLRDTVTMSRVSRTDIIQTSRHKY